MDNEHVAAKARPEIMADLLVGIEEPGVDGGVLVHGDRVARLRRVPATEPRRGHEDRLQRIAPSIRGELALYEQPSAWNSDARGRRTMVIAPRAGLGRGGSGDVWLKLLEELIFGVVADNAISFTTVLEEDHRRDRADAETAGGDGIGVDIQ